MTTVTAGVLAGVSTLLYLACTPVVRPPDRPAFQRSPVMELDLRKTAADAAYIAVGAGVLGFQQAQVRRKEAGERIATLAKDAQSLVETQPATVRNRVADGSTTGLDPATTTIKSLDP